MTNDQRQYADAEPEELAPTQRVRLNDRLRQLILMRETGPKSRVWHAARTRLIWRLHGEIKALPADAPQIIETPE
jgi:hypothetical protein